MARGWESKSVESQVEEALERQDEPTVRLTPAERQALQRRESLLLQRTRILNDLQTACNARYRSMLMEALRHLDGELASL